MRINEITAPTEYTITHMLLPRLAVKCSDFIQAAKQSRKLLYRGIANDFLEPAFTSHSPVNRPPTGQTPTHQKILDNIFRSTGFTALRSNSICCTPDLALANAFSYGDIQYVRSIFPHNGASYNWSSKIEDIGGSTALRNTLKAIDRDYSADDIPMDVAIDFVQLFDFKQTKLPDALASGNEILVHGTYTSISRYYTDLVCKYFGIEEGY